MSVIYWEVPKADLKVKADSDRRSLDGFDVDGIHKICRLYEGYVNCRKAPVASLDLGDVTKVLLKCQAGTKLKKVTESIDVSERGDGSEMVDRTTGFYPGAKGPFTYEETLAIVDNVDNHYFDPDAVVW